MQIKKVLITGAGGFIGSHLAERCVEQGFRVRALVRYNSRNDWGWLEHSDFADDIEVVGGDITDFDSVAGAMQGCDTVFHLAALIGIPYSYHSPLSYIKTNVIGTYNVLSAARAAKTKNVLITSTSETYGTVTTGSIAENHLQVAQSPYAASKIAADALAFSYFRSFDLPVKIVRPFNSYGPRQSARSVIPTIILQILGGRTSIQLGNVGPSRDFTYVADTVEGFWAIARSNKLFGEVTNIGTGVEISVEKLVAQIAKIMGKKVKIATVPERKRPKASEVERLLCDNTKLKRSTGFSPKYSIEKGLKLTVDWFSKNRNMYKGDIYNI